jgi:hypothetical protein
MYKLTIELIDERYYYDEFYYVISLPLKVQVESIIGGALQWLHIIFNIKIKMTSSYCRVSAEQTRRSELLWASVHRIELNELYKIKLSKQKCRILDRRAEWGWRWISVNWIMNYNYIKWDSNVKSFQFPLYLSQICDVDNSTALVGTSDTNGD